MGAPSIAFFGDGWDTTKLIFSAVILSGVEGPAVAFRALSPPQKMGANNGCPRSLAFGDRGLHESNPARGPLLPILKKLVPHPSPSFRRGVEKSPFRPRLSATISSGPQARIPAMRYTCRIGLHRFGFCPEARCVFSRDTAIRTADVPLAQTTRWRAVVRVLRSPIDSLSCALLPSSCALCGSPCRALFRSNLPCLLVGVPRPDRPRLRPLRRRLTAPATPTVSMLCRACRLARRPLFAPFRYGVYEGRMREAIHALKYDRLHPAARSSAGCWPKPSRNWPAKRPPKCW
jgi:hypothetical protein